MSAAIPDDAALTALLDLSFDFLCSRPLRELVDVTQLLPTLDASLTPDRVALYQERLATPLRERLIARAKDSAIKLGEWLPEAVTKELDELLGAPIRLPKKAVDDAVASEQVRENIRSMVQETLNTFISKGMSGESSSGGSGGAIRGLIGFGARAAVGVGKGLLGGVGDELQKQMQDRASSFVDSALASAQKRLAERLTSEETSKSLGKGRQKFFRRTQTRTEGEAVAPMLKLPWAKFEAMAPRVIAHNLAREALRKAIEEEARATFAVLADDTLGKILDDTGTRDLSRAALHAQGLPLLKSFIAREEFTQWWTKNAG